MGKNHKKNILTCLHDWHSIALQEAKALAAGDMETFEGLNKKSLLIQAKLDNILSNNTSDELEKEILDLMKKIHDLHSKMVEELQQGTKEFSARIGALRKNKVSLNGYKQHPSTMPRFMSERT